MLYIFHLCSCGKYSFLVLFLFHFLPSLSFPEVEADATNFKKVKTSREEVYLAIVYSESEETSSGTNGNSNALTIERMMKPILSSYAPRVPDNFRLLPIFTPLPKTFNLSFIETLLEIWRNKTVLGVLLFGAESSGFGVTLAAQSLNIPVLWSTGHVTNGYLEKTKISTWEVRFEAGSSELLGALRSFLIVTHWHSFTVISTITPLSVPLLTLLREPPLLPTIFQLRTDAVQHAIFRVLTEVSRSTKGVVVLVCDERVAKKILTESKRLNMADGDFVWIWVDTAAKVTATNDQTSKSHDCDSNSTAKVNVVLKKSSLSTSSRVRRHSNKTIIDAEHHLSENTNGSNVNPTAFLVPKIQNQASDNSNQSGFYGIGNVHRRPVMAGTLNFGANLQKLGVRHMGGPSTESSKLFAHSLSNKKYKQTNSDKSIHSDKQTPSDQNIIDSNVHSSKIENPSNNGSVPKSLNSEQTVRNSDNKTLFSIGMSKVRASLGIKQSQAANRPLQGFPTAESDKLTRSDLTTPNDTTEGQKLNGNAVRSDEERRSKRWTVHRKHNSTNSFNFVHTVNNLVSQSLIDKKFNSSLTRSDNNLSLPIGLLAIRPLPIRIDQMFVENCFRLMLNGFFGSMSRWCNVSVSGSVSVDVRPCWQTHIRQLNGSLSLSFLNFFYSKLKSRIHNALRGLDDSSMMMLGDKNSMAARFQILNLVPEQPAQSLVDYNDTGETKKWRVVGEIVGESDVRLDSLVWPGGQLVPDSTGKGARSVFRIVTAIAPPFVMEGELDEDGQCLRGLECHRILTSDKDNLTLVFNEMERIEEQEELVDDKERERLEKMQDIWGIRPANSLFSNSRNKYVTNCCYGLTMDLLENVAHELEFDFHLYLVADGSYGTKIVKDGSSGWNGIVGDLVSGAAHMSFSALSVSSVRAEVIDFTAPYFFSGVSLLAAPKQRNDIPLLAFLLPFSPELWIAIFTSLHVTAVAVAIYEWLSPFGLNPWGRQRSKNFSMASALWVMWGLLCGHLVQFKAPKSWPNKFLINVWGGFSVIFVASYTANIAALIAGLFFQIAVGDYHDRNLLLQRVGAPWASAADYYVRRNNPQLWEHMQRYAVKTVAEGVHHLKNGSLDILIADTPILDYYRATDHGCKLQKIGDTINEDTYAVGMTKGFPLKDSVSAVIAKYSSNGYMDILTEKWYGGLPCFKLASDMAQPRPLGIAAVAGVFLLLGLGMVVGCVILFIEHLFYKHTLPILRQKPKGTIWRSRNIMFFSQKLYRFINCVELVSPHHAARELVHTLRQGQITSLFQKSVKRKEHEQRNRRKSKGQFFEMIQEIRRVQQEERKDYDSPGHNKGSPKKKHKKMNNNNSKSPQLLLSPPELMKQQRRLSPSRLDIARRLSKDFFRSKSSSNLSVRRLSSDISMAAGKFFDVQNAQAIGRRLSHGFEENSPPDVNSRRSSQKAGESTGDTSPAGSGTFTAAGTNGNDVDTPATEPPRSPNLLSPGFYFGSRLPYEPPRSPREVGPVAARRFTYTDTSLSSPNFTKKLPPRATTLPSPSAGEAPKVVINCDNSDNLTEVSEPIVRTGSDEVPESVFKEEDEDNREVVGGSPLDRNNWSNVSDKSTEHMIEIFIPASKQDSIEEEVDENGKSSNSRSKHRSLSRDQDLVHSSHSTKPKIVSYVPKKVTKSTETELVAPKSSGSVIKLDSSQSPLDRLSKAELIALTQLTEAELKSKLFKALQSKEPT